MTDDFEIEIIDDEKKEEPNVQLPMNFITVGEVQNDDVKVYIKQTVFKKLESYSSSDVEHELGSILVGDYSDSNGKINIVISDYIEAKYTDASVSTLTFTHKSWDYIHNEHEKKHADKRILGWQHTHPGYGVFLSNYDIFIQENFFDLPFQIAYVIDPKQRIRGFFQWKDGKIEKIKGFYIYDEVGKPIKVDLSKVEEKKPQKMDTPQKAPSFITIILLVSVVFLGGMVFNLSSHMKKQVALQSELESMVNLQKSQLDVINDYKEKTKTTEPTTKAVTTTLATTNPKVIFVKYRVKSGDSLYSICKKNNLDFNSNLNIIKSINGISDANSIITGQILLLPDYNGAE